MNKPICLYHGGGCHDGFGAAFAFWKRYGDALEYLPVQHGQPPPDVSDRHVLILDFSYQRYVLEEMALSARSILVIDHHKSAAGDLHGFPERGIAHYIGWDFMRSFADEHRGTHIATIFDMNRSGAAMAWDFCFPEADRAELIQYIQDRDLWTKKLPGIDEFTAGLGLAPMEFKVWDQFLAGVDSLIEAGRVALVAKRILIEATKKRAHMGVINGYTVPVVNCDPSIVSEVVGELSEGHPFAAGYFLGPDGATFSLRSRETGIDVQELAVSMGGGGHPRAAGFPVTPYLEWITKDGKLGNVDPCGCVCYWREP